MTDRQPSDGDPHVDGGTAWVVRTAGAGLAVTYALLGILALAVLVPGDQTSSAGSDLLDTLVDQGTGWWLTARWLFLVTSLFGLGLVVGVRRLAPADRAAVGDWAAAVGGLGFAAVALDQVRLIAHVPALADAVATSPERIREFTNLSILNLSDRFGLVTFGAVGLWLLAMSLLALPRSAPTWLIGSGVLAACVFLTAAVFEGEWTSVVAGIGALTVGPVFFGGLAVSVRGWTATAERAGPVRDG